MVYLYYSTTMPSHAVKVRERLSGDGRLRAVFTVVQGDGSPTTEGKCLLTL